jgi:hypothetical protein
MKKEYFLAIGFYLLALLSADAKWSHRLAPGFPEGRRKVVSTVFMVTGLWFTFAGFNKRESTTSPDGGRSYPRTPKKNPWD